MLDWEEAVILLGEEFTPYYIWLQWCPPRYNNHSNSSFVIERIQEFKKTFCKIDKLDTQVKV